MNVLYVVCVAADNGHLPQTIVLCFVSSFAACDLFMGLAGLRVGGILLRPLVLGLFGAVLVQRASSASVVAERIGA